MRIGVNALYLIPGHVGGTEIYLRSLLTALAAVDPANQYFIYTNSETGADLVPQQPNFHHAPQRLRAHFRPARILWEQTILPFAAARHRLDILFNPGYTAPLLAPFPMATVLHDLQHKRHPEHFRWFDLPFWRVLLYAAARRSRIVIASSESTKADLVQFYKLPERKIRVAGLGVDPAFFELRVSPAEPRYLLAVSTLHPHKNLDRLMRAFARFHREHPEYTLAIAGLRGFYTEQLEKLRDELGLADAVRFTGWIPRDELYRLYAGAWAFFYPSTFEGFGMPVLEALAAGIPAACSSVEPLASLAGEAALQFDPHDESAIHDAMARLCHDRALREMLSKAGPARAALHSWEQTARLTLEAIRDALR